MKTFLLKSVAIPLMAIGLTVSNVQAADVTMNLSFGAPEDSIYGRFAKIFKVKS
jgi:hypothetical protein